MTDQHKISLSHILAITKYLYKFLAKKNSSKIVILIYSLHFLRNGLKYQFIESYQVYKYLPISSHRVSLVKRHKVEEASLILARLQLNYKCLKSRISKATFSQGEA